MSLAVTLYNKPACPQCTATERKLVDLGIKFSHEPALDEKNLSYIKGLGHLQAPVVTVVNDDGELVNHWSGYRPDLLGELVA